MKKQEHFKDSDLALSYGFLPVFSEMEVESVCKNGLEVGNYEFGCLGNPAYGIYLSRFSDVVNPLPPSKIYSGTFVIFRVLMGRIASVVLGASQMQPLPCFDCHICKTVSSQRLYDSAQMYLYEYCDTDLLSSLCRFYPVAVIRYNGLLRNIPPSYTMWVGTFCFGEEFTFEDAQINVFSARTKSLRL
ncbi:unnamed protein product [Soboliphyme baturini]|uniref:DUF3715 domain-containing protein n=1 Tax=Soboliphyme baturini TaxID=241478 RepID=A0A183J755_9BILA|nr:unnamed protein product [Soboliphyme baturini]